LLATDPLNQRADAASGPGGPASGLKTSYRGYPSASRPSSSSWRHVGNDVLLRTDCAPVGSNHADRRLCAGHLLAGWIVEGVQSHQFCAAAPNAPGDGPGGGKPAAGLRPAGRVLQLRGDLLIGPGRGRCPMPGPAARISRRMGGLRRCRVHLTSLRERRRPVGRRAHQRMPEPRPRAGPLPPPAPRPEQPEIRPTSYTTSWDLTSIAATPAWRCGRGGAIVALTLPVIRARVDPQRSR
jgi:hypothetical protein